MECYVKFCDWDESQEALFFTIVSGNSVTGQIQLISLEGEVVRRKLLKLRKGVNQITINGLSGLLPGSYGWRFSYTKTKNVSGVVIKR